MCQSHCNTHFRIDLALYTLSILTIICPISQPISAVAEETRQISASGHGGLFDQHGKEIKLTLDFVARAQQWYREQLDSDLHDKNRQSFNSFENKLLSGIDAKGQDAFILQHQAIGG